MKEKGGFIKISFAEVNNWNKAQSSEIIVAPLQQEKKPFWIQHSVQNVRGKPRLHKASSHKDKAILQISLLQKLTKILPSAAPPKRGINTRLSPKSPYKLSPPCLLWSIQTDQQFHHPLKPYSLPPHYRPRTEKLWQRWSKQHPELKPLLEAPGTHPEEQSF